MQLFQVQNRQPFKSASFYEWFLDLEKKRNLRTGGSVCVLNIDFQNLLEKRPQYVSTGHHESFLPVLVEQIRNQVRESDILFFIGYSIKIILTNTTRQGAYVAAKRIFKVIQRFELETEFARANGRVVVQITVWDYTVKMKYITTVYQEKEIEPWKPFSMNS